MEQMDFIFVFWKLNISMKKPDYPGLNPALILKFVTLLLNLPSVKSGKKSTELKGLLMKIK